MAIAHSRRANRIAWIMSHTTQREFEVPMIRSLGYEVYTSKLTSKDIDFRSGSTDYSDDQNSTLPQDALDCLNRQNFYDDCLSDDTIEVLNEHFDTVFAAGFGKLITEMPRHFKGRILFRAPGREMPYNYEQLYVHFGGKDILQELAAIRHRFWFAPCYPSIPLAEGPFLRERAAVLPLGMPDRIFDRGDIWQGTDRRLFFVCPGITSHPYYYGRIYRDFKKQFGDLPHLIGGGQPKPVDDPMVSGRVSDEVWESRFRELRVMYYHSREPRHIHYHPLEAMAYGMPVVFMRGGVLEEFGGANQPGACNTVEEAREKVQRLLEGDAELAQSIRKAQGIIVDHFRPSLLRPDWERLFAGQVMSTPLAAAA